MDTTLLFKCLAFFLVTYLTIKHIITMLCPKHKNLPPSPFLCLPIIGHLYLFKKPLHRSLARLATRYGQILYLRFGVRPVLILSSPEAVEEGFVKNNAFVDRPQLLPGKYNGYNYTTMTWAPYGPSWRNQRRIAAAEIFSSQQLQTLTGLRADVVQSFIRRVMKESVENDNVVEMKFAILGLALDNMLRMLVGCNNLQKTEASRRFLEIVDEGFRLGGATNIEDFLPFLKVFWVFFESADDRLRKTKEEKDVFMQELIVEHKELEKEQRLSDERKRTVLHVLLSLQKEDPITYSDEMIRGFILTFIQAAIDISASAIVWAFSLLLNHPKALEKAQVEMDANVGHNRLVEESDKDNLPYLQCIINETLRMYPTGPLGLPYESRADCEVGGYNVPRGSMVLYNIWAIHNDPNIWDEPRKFMPERFMGIDLTKLGFKYIPFGTGKRVCPGENLARKMVWLAIATMVQCFEWERVGEELVDMTEGKGVSLAKLNSLHAKGRPRPCMKNVLPQI